MYVRSDLPDGGVAQRHGRRGEGRPKGLGFRHVGNLVFSSVLVVSVIAMVLDFDCSPTTVKIFYLRSCCSHEARVSTRRADFCTSSRFPDW